MSEWLTIGRRVGDIKFMHIWNKNRGMIEADTALIRNAVDLELIPGGFDGKARGIVLTDARWGSQLYCLIKRAEWTEENYFDYAEKRFKELGVHHGSTEK